MSILPCKDCDNTHENSFLPQYFIYFDGKEVISFNFTKTTWSGLSAAELKAVDTSAISANPVAEVMAGTARGQAMSKVAITPLRKYKGRYQKLSAFSYKTIEAEKPGNTGSAASSKRTAATDLFKTSSVLASGKWYKIACPSDRGIFKIDYALLNSMGLNPAGTDPRKLRVFGNGAQMLPQLNLTLRPDDLVETPLYVSGEEDGVFNTQDFALFYSPGSITYSYDPTNKMLVHKQNIYSDSAYYFITIGTDNGLRIQTDAAYPAQSAVRYNTFDNSKLHERELLNALKSGQKWYGEILDFVSATDITLDFPNLVPNTPIKVHFSGMNAGQNQGGFGQDVYNIFSTKLNGNPFYDLLVPAVYQGDYSPFGANTEKFAVWAPGFPAGTTKLVTSIGYDRKGLAQAAGYIDYLEITAKCSLALAGSQTNFRAFESTQRSQSGYDVTAPESAMIWDVSNPLRPFRKAVTKANGVHSFDASGDTLREFTVFNGSDFPVPTYIKQVANQNLHALTDLDLLIVTPAQFYDQAKRLASYRTEHDQLKTEVLTTEQIYNEFSSGAQDAIAIRTVARMLYGRGSTNKIKYMLLFGDCSYDYKHRITGNTNMVPTWESPESMSQIDSYCSDDFFAFMDINEGRFGSADFDLMDIGIGRLPVSTLEQATQVTDKLLGYASENTFGRWRNKTVFVADDGNYYLHQSCADQVSNELEALNPDYTPVKIYLGAYNRVAGAGGYTSPDCRRALNLAIEEGCLMVNFSGHGSEVQWTDERIFDTELIHSLTNKDRLSLFVTATCDFGRCDDPGRISGSEALVLQVGGGGIGSVTTSRPVYADNNLTLNKAFTKQAFLRINGEYQRLGEIFRVGKNASIARSSGAGNRGFILLTDPSLKLNYAEDKVVLTSINGKPGNRVKTIIDSTYIPDLDTTIYTSRSVPEYDTLRGLDRVTLTGEVRNQADALLNNFNGTVNTTVYDVQSRITSTEAGRTSSSFLEYKNVLYNGIATVTNGKFTLSFIVPRDITYDYGKGKISFYAMNNTKTDDAAGEYNEIVIGGSNDQAGTDNQPPLIKLFMNDTSFINGGITDANPYFLAMLSDDNGINVSTTGIGHEMSAIVDGNTEGKLVLNQYYTSESNDYRKGSVYYHMLNLEEGPHEISFKAWDTYNNSSTASINFIVAKGALLALDQIFNYPNPFSDYTDFSIAHNFAGKDLTASVEVFDASGRQITIMSAHYDEAPARLNGDDFRWNTNDGGNKDMSPGVYMFRVTLQTKSGQTARKAKQMVLIR
ncbi:MAG: type IX secretion system sortase PorU [Bacteroidota bacterium]